MRCAGAVLAGGRSERMGRPKAWLLGPNGRPLIEEALAALREAGAGPLFIGCAEGDAAAFAGLDATPVVDRRPGLGPLSGLEAILEAAPSEWVLLVACDMPALDPALLRDLIARATAGEREAVIPEVEGRLQPLHGIYHRRCLAKVSAALDAGDLRLTALAASLDAERVPSAGTSFTNLNTPEDLSAAGLDGAQPQ